MSEGHDATYDVKFKSSDFYYQNNAFGDVGLDDYTCKKYLGSKFEADEAKSKFTEAYCKGIFSQESPLNSDIRECYNFSLCKNKDVAQKLEVKASSKNSSNQNKNDSESYYRIQLLQTINLGVGTFMVISGIVLINLRS